ncbi:conserved exported hypothetical protein [Candidatus Sulfotelmatobacter kueseliae]|uniref:Uncharacterized protein n=1 Tax=Candidatus Sulfotelmatobacter kueseliae TaxID=2042962 RepID=A0A2U3KNS2_9BACT|nr:conserved exported hypothetical protein [Candidatus Sulfotelmatobacter kueseliae]
MKSLRVFLLVMCAAPLAFGADHEFREIVHTIEGAYGVHHSHIPFLGAVMFVARPEGVSGMKIAFFEDFKMPADAADVCRMVESSLGPGWYPFIRVRSRADGETTLIYTSPSGGKMRMMIVSLEPSEATVVELNLSDRAIKRWLKEPGEEAEEQSGHHRHHDDD